LRKTRQSEKGNLPPKAGRAKNSPVANRAKNQTVPEDKDQAAIRLVFLFS
jgi:hypothetical protein